MALDHVHQSAGVVVVARTVLQGELLIEHNVHVIDVLIAPHRFEQAIRKANTEQVQHRRAPEKMINAVHLVLRDQLGEQLVQAGGALLIGAESFPAPALSPQAATPVGGALQAATVTAGGNAKYSAGGRGQESIRDCRSSAFVTSALS